MKKATSFLLILLITLMPISVNASGIDILMNAITNKEEKLSGLDMIYNILGIEKKNNDKDVKIISSEKELEEVREDEVNEELIGIDVSKWNSNIDWKRVKAAGVQFAIIRAGYGQNTVDYQFKANIEGCIENDIYVGIYWFSYALNDNMGVKEAKKCIEVIEPYREYIKLPIFYDLEYDSVLYARRNGVNITKAKCTNITEAFCSEIEKNGYKTGIYTNLDFINNYYTKDILDRRNVWLASWSNDVDVKPRYTGDYICWQYTDSAYVDGIIGKVDGDIFYGDKYE